MFGMIQFWTLTASKLAENLLHVYRSSSIGVLRFRLIYLLSETLIELSNRNFQFSRVALFDIKPLIISCLTMQETKESDIRILRKIVSFILYNVVKLEDCEWEELRDCILSLVETEPSKAFLVFIDLPLLYMKFMVTIKKRVLEKAADVLRNPEEGRDEYWSLALEVIARIGVQQTQLQRHTMVKAVLEIVKKVSERGMNEHIETGLDDLKQFLLRKANLYDEYRADHITFVARFGFLIAASYKTIEQGKNMSNEILSAARNPECHDDGYESYDRHWFNHLSNLSSIELLIIYSWTDLHHWSRELAIRRLKFVLSNHTQSSHVLPRNHISVMRQLRPLLITCLEEEEISDRIFNVLAEVVNLVNCQMLIWEEGETWFGLRDYIALNSQTEFEKAVCVFQCLTMELNDNDFVIPVMFYLLPEISLRLSPPTEILVDNSCWALAFTGGFCAIVRLIETSIHVEAVKEIAHKMVDSVKELVERKMEVGIVKRAFRDVESIVKKQVEWYDTSEYKFVKGLFWKLNVTPSLTTETKLVLWRINYIVEREVDDAIKKQPKNDLDWLNQSQD